MDVRIISKHIKITKSIREEIEEKVSGFPKFYNSVIDAEVIVEGNEGGVTRSVEIIVRAKHNHIFVAKKAGQDMYECVDDAVKKIETQIKKQKQKERDNKHINNTAE